MGNFQTYVGSETAWTVKKSVDDETVALRIGEPPKTATYTLQVRGGGCGWGLRD